MKFLIWFLCFLANAIIITLIKEAGIILGGIPTALMFVATWWLAQTLCKKWDARKEIKEIVKNASTPKPQPVVADTDQVRFCRKCGERLVGNSRFCRKCGTEIVVVYKINDDTPSVVNPMSDTIWICGKCKAKNLNSRNICWSCGSPQ